MARHLLTAVLLIALAISSWALAGRLKDSHLPGNQEGYEPVQPIAFSHRQHAGQLQISCYYCHSGAENSPHAGFPAGSVCMTCHRFVTAPQADVLPEILDARKARRTPRPIISSELQKLYAAMGLNNQMEPDPGKKPTPIAWIRVHQLPAYTCFDHRAHVQAGVDCQRCHGPVETMDRVRQVADLSMGWCVDCHRQPGRRGMEGRAVAPSTDCATCHH